MKVVAIYASDRKNSNSQALVDKALEYLGENNEVKKYRLPEMKIDACMGCFACRKKEICARKDDMSELYKAIIEADFVIFSTPVYCIDVSGSFKLMYDRLYPMLDGKPGSYKPRHPNKKCMLIMTQGAPNFMFRQVPKRINKCLKMNGFNNLGTVVYGLGNETGKVLNNKRVLKKIQKICSKAL